MSLFSTREPRRFRGVHIYTSERQDRLDRLVADARRQEQMDRGEETDYKPDIESYRGKFAKNLKHVSRHNDPDRHHLHPAVAIVLIALLCLAWHYLRTGSF